MKTLLKLLILIIVLNQLSFVYASFGQITMNNLHWDDSMSNVGRRAWVQGHLAEIYDTIHKYGGNNSPTWHLRSYRIQTTVGSSSPSPTYEYFNAANDSIACVLLNTTYDAPYYDGPNSYDFQEVQIGETITGCKGHDSNYVQINTVKCYELGTENPSKPKNAGAPTENGIWVHLIYNITNRLGTYDSIFDAVVSNGCAGVNYEGFPLASYNAFDTCYTDTIDMTPQLFCTCSYDGNILTGTCLSNGIDTACGGQTPFIYTSRDDSIVNKCKFGENIDPPSDPQKRELDSLSTNSTNPDGYNRLSDDIRTEHALDRKIMNDQLNEQRQSNGFLRNLVSITQGISQKITDNFNKLFGKLDSNYIGSGDTTALSNGGHIDTSDGIGDYDTGSVMNNFREKYSDTVDLIIKNDSLDSIVSVYQKFAIEIFEGDCECSSDWFAYTLDVPYSVNLNLDICPYNLHLVTKPLFKLAAIYLLFVFYRKFMFKILLDVFK